MIEAMKQALEALESATPKYTRQRADQKTLGGALDYWKLEQHQRLKAITSLRQAIAEAEKHEVSQEPVALMVVNGEISYKSTDDDQSFGMWCPVNYDSSHSFPDGTKFYIHPQPKREWVGLTDEEIEACYKQGGIGKAIQMLKEKNHG
jgi:hypothetical protein